MIGQQEIFLNLVERDAKADTIIVAFRQLSQRKDDINTFTKIAPPE